MKITIEVQSDTNFDPRYFIIWLNSIQKQDRIYKGLNSVITEINGKNVEKLYGLYSEKQSIVSGISVYTNNKGDLVHVTEVSKNPNHNGSYDDTIRVGEVCYFVRRFLVCGEIKDDYIKQ